MQRRQFRRDGAGAPQGTGLSPAPVGTGLSLEARIARAEADIRVLTQHVEEHTKAIASIIVSSNNPELMKKNLQVSP